MTNKSISVLLVEDQEITRLGLKTMLERLENLCIVGEAANGIDAVRLAKELQPALVLMDIGMPLMDGIEATKMIKETVATKVILITACESDNDVLAGLTAGADAYCRKNISSERLSNAVNSVLGGALWLDTEIARIILQIPSSKETPGAGSTAALHSTPQAKKVNPFLLSERELEVLCLLVNGHSNQQMADKLCLSPETVKTHMRHLMEKLSVSDRTQAAVKAVRQGLVPEIRA